MTDKVLAKLSTLRTMPPSDLRALWFELYQTDAPQGKREYLIKRLAYRIQELAYGGNSDDVERRLSAKAHEHFSNTSRTKRTQKKTITGSVLVRTYHGVEHHVAVLDDGYQYMGVKYRSLSAIARHITGMAWSGNAFFGLNKKLEVLHG